MDKTMRDLPCRRIQVDEIWSFVQVKAKNSTAAQREKGAGDCWTWIALDAESKLIPSWHVGGRGFDDAYKFIHDLKSRLKYRVQLTSDGHAAYLEAVEDAFGAVEFRLPVQNGIVSDLGEFIVSGNPEGLLSVDIAVTHPTRDGADLAQTRYHLAQTDVDRIERGQDGSKAAFRLWW